MTIFGQLGLETQINQIYNLESEFSERYLSFRNGVVAIMQPFIRKLRDARFPMGNTLEIKLNSIFRGFEGSIHVPLDGQPFKLDPVKFDDMVSFVMKNCDPTNQHERSNEFKKTDLKGLKNLAVNAATAIGAFGISEPLGMVRFLNAVNDAIKSIDVSSKEVIQSNLMSLQSVEVKKAGTLFITSYMYSLVGRTENGYLRSNNFVKLDILVKVWKFTTIGDLKDKYCELTKEKYTGNFVPFH